VVPTVYFGAYIQWERLRAKLVGVFVSTGSYLEQDKMVTVKNHSYEIVLLEEEEEEWKVINCPRCGFEMKHLQSCHLICTNCGGHMDCSEKGLTW
jgi:hypothetical protein